MQEPRLFHFGPFRLDVRNQQLWRGSEGIHLTSKALAVLHYLVEHQGQLPRFSANNAPSRDHRKVPQTRAGVGVPAGAKGRSIS